MRYWPAWYQVLLGGTAPTPPPTAYAWKTCDGDLDAGILAAGYTDVDFAFLCVLGLWARCYRESPSMLTPTNPTVLKQPEIIPTDCSDLIGWHTRDDFTGNGANSGALMDINWNIRWREYISEGTPFSEILADALKIETNSTSASWEWLWYAINTSEDVQGEFTFTVPWSWIQSSGGARDLQLIGIEVRTAASDEYRIIRLRDDSRPDPNLYEASDTTSAKATALTSDNSEVFTITRDAANNLSVLYGATVLYTWTGVTEDIATFDVFAGNYDSAGVFTGVFNSVSLVDGNSDDIYIDPSGGLCT